jgi:flagellar basal-body rod protein FlgG
MNRALYAAATGMAAQQQQLDTIADNLANADVAGFKRATATFAALGDGLGTAPSGLLRSFEQGKLEKSGGPCDLAIDGPGFFQVERDGARAYTRAGAFARGPDGSLRTPEGWRLHGIRVPADAVALEVAPDGRMTARLPGGLRRSLGRVTLAQFDAPERLQPLGSALFAATPAAGKLRVVTPGSARGPALAFGMLERANVSIYASMIEILTAQRAYEANAKAVQASDEMLRIANNLHRS